MTHRVVATCSTSNGAGSVGVSIGLLRLLSFVDDLPAGATGALRFSDQGVVLLQERRICWAVARGMRTRLTDILRGQSTGAWSREAVEALYRACQRSGTPLGEALVASGMASEAGLRAALQQHNGEAIVALARSGALPDSFVNHTKTGYDPRFSFASVEVLAALGACDDPARAVAARHELAECLVEESTGAAFTRSSSASGARVIAVEKDCEVSAADLVQLCNWVSSLFDLARTADAETYAARLAWGVRNALVIWRSEDANFVGICQSRAAAARLVSRVSERRAQRGGPNWCEGVPP